MKAYSIVINSNGSYVVGSSEMENGKLISGKNVNRFCKTVLGNDEQKELSAEQTADLKQLIELDETAANIAKKYGIKKEVVKPETVEIEYNDDIKECHLISFKFGKKTATSYVWNIDYDKEVVICLSAHSKAKSRRPRFVHFDNLLDASIIDNAELGKVRAAKAEAEKAAREAKKELLKEQVEMFKKEQAERNERLTKMVTELETADDIEEIVTDISGELYDAAEALYEASDELTA